MTLTKLWRKWADKSPEYEPRNSVESFTEEAQWKNYKRKILPNSRRRVCESSNSCDLVLFTTYISSIALMSLDFQKVFHTRLVVGYIKTLLSYIA